MRKEKKKVKRSILDSYDKENLSKTCQTGFFNLVYLASFFWLVSSIVISYVEQQTFPGVDILILMASRLDLIPAWILLCGYSFTAFFLQKAIVNGLPLKLGLLLHHILQMILFSSTIYWLFVSEWPIIQVILFFCFFYSSNFFFSSIIK